MAIIRCGACNSPFGYFYVREAHPDQYYSIKKLLGSTQSRGFEKTHTQRVLVMTPNQDYHPNETVIGCIEIIPLPANAAYLGRLKVIPQFRNNGLGLRLVNEALNYCAERNLTAIFAITKNSIVLGKHGWIKSSAQIFDMYIPQEIRVHCTYQEPTYWACIIKPIKEELNAYTTP